MAKLIDFYKQHRRLFIVSKHENLKKTERFRDSVMIKFLQYCEANKIFHTAGIKKQTAKNFFNTPQMIKLSKETRRKYYLVIKEFYRRHLKIELAKEDILL